jgi:hypothetical protein
MSLLNYESLIQCTSWCQDTGRFFDRALYINHSQHIQSAMLYSEFHVIHQSFVHCHLVVFVVWCHQSVSLFAQMLKCPTLVQRVLILLSMPCLIVGVQVFWTGDTNGDWENPSNWSPAPPNTFNTGRYSVGSFL